MAEISEKVTFNNSINGMFKNLGDQLTKSFNDPTPIFGNYAWESIPMIFLFFISRRLASPLTIYKTFKKKTTTDNSENTTTTTTEEETNDCFTGHLGNMFVEFSLMMISYSISFWSICQEQSHELIHFGNAINQGIATIIPILTIIHFWDSFKFAQKISKKSFFMYDILQGIVVFLLYNWIINFQRYHQNTVCNYKINQQDIKNVYMDIYKHRQISDNNNNTNTNDGDDTKNDDNTNTNNDDNKNNNDDNNKNNTKKPKQSSKFNGTAVMIILILTLIFFGIVAWTVFKKK